MSDDGDKNGKGVCLRFRWITEIDAPGVNAQVRFAIQGVAQRADKRWPEDRDMIE